jgi:glycerophosphoryl diester phosphodiesterase
VDEKKSKSCLLCGHRGASGHAPENTLAAFRLAIDMGVDLCELDVQQTGDDRFAVIHDTTLGRTTNGRGAVWKHTLAALQKLDAGSWYGKSFADERVPSLEDVMALARGSIKLNIELKTHGHERNVAKLLVAAIRRERFENDCLISSFDHRLANEIKSLAPELVVGYIFGKLEFNERLFSGRANVLSAHFPLITGEFIKKARKNMKQIHAWTVDRPEDMRRMVAVETDVIITNYPDRFFGL